MPAAKFFQAPGTRVGHLDTDAAQQRSHVGRVPQVETLVDRDVAQHQLVAFGHERRRGDGVRRARPDECADQCFGDGQVDGETVVLQLGAELLRR